MNIPLARRRVLAILPVFPHFLAACAIGIGFSAFVGEFVALVARASGTSPNLNTLRHFGQLSEFELIVAMLIGVPLEEFLFRKVGFIVLRGEGLSTFSTIVVTSLAFGAVHIPGGISVFAGATTTGLLLGWLYSSKDLGLTKAIVSHLAINFTGYVMINRIPSALSIEAFTLPIWIYIGSAILLIAGIALHLYLNGAVAWQRSNGPIA